MKTLLKSAALLGLLAGCLVPTLDELDQEKTRLCDTEHPCLPGYACVEDHCQPEEGTECRPGTSTACGKDTGECKPGTRACSEEGRYGPCTEPVLPTDEVCNGKDDDCDGTVDEGLSCENTGNVCEECSAAGRTCWDGKCGGCLDTHFENGTQCQPKLELGKNCTDGRICDSGFCVDGVCCNVSACNTPPPQCYASKGTCSGLTGMCQYAPLPNTTACDDGNKCTESDKCDGAGQCVSGNSKVCNQPDQCQESNSSCKSTTGECVYPAKPTGTPCNDGSGCTGNDMCDGAGSCSGSYLCCNNQYCNGTQCVCTSSPCMECAIE
jgi:hypothetical protein